VNPSRVLVGRVAGGATIGRGAYGSALRRPPRDEIASDARSDDHCRSTCGLEAIDPERDAGQLGVSGREACHNIGQGEPDQADPDRHPANHQRDGRIDLR
jgi:hypothetical protein